MKQHQFFAEKLPAKFLHHCFAFHTVQLIDFFILYSFDTNNWIRSSFSEGSFNVLVFFTAGRQFDLMKYAFSQRLVPGVWN